MIVSINSKNHVLTTKPRGSRLLYNEAYNTHSHIYIHGVHSKETGIFEAVAMGDDFFISR